MRRRHAAMVACALIAGVFEAAHTLTYERRVNGWGVAFMALSILVELETLSAIFDFSLWRRRSPLWSLSLPAAVGIGAGILERFAGWAIQSSTDLPIMGPWHRFSADVVAEIGAFNGLLGLGFWAIAIVLPDAARDAAERAHEAGQLRTAAELARLRAHLQPHFLLNTLSTVAGLVVEDPHGARDLVGALGDLLRDSLEESDDMQTLEDEVKWLKRYAEILETRHRGSITFRWEIAEAACRVRVPRLLLQPLLENAVKHGALRRREGGEVSVSARIDPGSPSRVTFVVEDNGPGPGTRAPRPGALGIQLVKRRLSLQYADAATFRLEAREGRTRSIVEIPREGGP